MAELEITKNNFTDEVMNSDIPVLLDFWATWCGPCRMISPIVKELAEEYSGKLKVGKVNVDKEAELASAFGITSIPTIVLIKNGKTVNSSIGFMTKDQLVKMINNEIRKIRLKQILSRIFLIHFQDSADTPFCLSLRHSLSDFHLLPQLCDRV